MSGGGKGGSSTTEVKIPEWLESAARSNIAKANEVANIGYTPYYGPDVAAMTPMQMAAGQGINTAATAFGLGPADLSMGMPAPQTFAGGVQGYSSGALYDQSLAELRRRAPGQYDAITGMFIDPQTGARPLSFGPSMAPMPLPAVPTMAPVEYGGGSAPLSFSAPVSSGSDRSTTSINTPLSFAPGGVNTRNPSSTFNRVVAAATPPQQTGAPAVSRIPVARPAPVTSSGSDRSSDRVATKSTTSKGTGASKYSTKSTIGSKKSGSSSGSKKK